MLFRSPGATGGREECRRRDKTRGGQGRAREAHRPPRDRTAAQRRVEVLRRVQRRVQRRDGPRSMLFAILIVFGAYAILGAVFGLLEPEYGWRWVYWLIPPGEVMTLVTARFFVPLLLWP